MTATGRRLTELEITPEILEAGEDVIYQSGVIEGGLSRTEIQNLVAAVDEDAIDA